MIDLSNMFQLETIFQNDDLQRLRLVRLHLESLTGEMVVEDYADGKFILQLDVKDINPIATLELAMDLLRYNSSLNEVDTSCLSA